MQTGSIIAFRMPGHYAVSWIDHVRRYAMTQLGRRDFLAGAVAATAAVDLALGASAPQSTYPTARDCFGLLKRGKKIPVIFDTDIGGDIDDTWALCFLLKCPELDVKLSRLGRGQRLLPCPDRRQDARNLRANRRARGRGHPAG
jgi:hypothetical protein